MCYRTATRVGCLCKRKNCPCRKAFTAASVAPTPSDAHLGDFKDGKYVYKTFSDYQVDPEVGNVALNTYEAYSQKFKEALTLRDDATHGLEKIKDRQAAKNRSGAIIYSTTATYFLPAERFPDAERLGVFLMTGRQGFGLEVFYTYVGNWIRKGGGSHTTGEFTTLVNSILQNTNRGFFCSDKTLRDFLFAMCANLSDKFLDTGCECCKG
jgi:hypothetical protein